MTVEEVIEQYDPGVRVTRMRRRWELVISEAAAGHVYADLYKDDCVVASGVGSDEPEAILNAAKQLSGEGGCQMDHPQEVA